MTIATTQITGPIFLPNVVAPYKAAIEFELVDWDKQTDEAVFVSGPFRAPIDDLGNFSVDVATNTENHVKFSYKIHVLYGLPSKEVRKEYLGSVSVSGEGPYKLSQLDITRDGLEAGSFDLYNYFKSNMSQANTAAQTATQAATDAQTAAQQASAYGGPSAADAASLRTDTGFTYAAGQPGTVAVGDVIQTRAEGHSYRVLPVIATAYNIETAGGVRLNVIRDGVGFRLSAWGVDFSGNPADAQTNRIRFQEALDYLYDHEPASTLVLDGGGHLIVDRPPCMRSTVNLEGNGCTIENNLSAEVPGESLAVNSLSIGSFATQDDNDYSWTALNAVAAGDVFIEAQNGSTSWTAVGNEIVFLNATATNTPTSSFGDGVAGQGGGNGDYNSTQVRVVSRIVGNRIYLDMPVDESIAAGAGTIADVNDAATGAYATDVSWSTVNSTREAGLYGSAARHVVSRIFIRNLRLKSASGHHVSRLGWYKCHLQNVVVEATEDNYHKYGFASNLMQYCTVDNWESPFWVRAFEVAGHSKHSRFSKLNIWRHEPEGVTLPAQEPLIRYDGEFSRFISVTDSIFTLGDVQQGNAALKFTGGQDCVFKDNEVSVSGAGLVITLDDQGKNHIIENNLFRGEARYGLDVKGIENTFRGNRLHVNCSHKAVRVRSEADACVVSHNDFGNGVLRIEGDPAAGLRPSIVSDNQRLLRFENTGRAIVMDNMTEGWHHVMAEVLAWDETALVSASATSETEIHDELVIPAGVFEKDMQLHFEFEGVKTGTTGDVTLELIMAVDTNQDGADDDVTDDRSVSLRWTFGNAVETTFKGVVSFRVANFSAVEFRAEARAGVELYSNANTKTGMDFANRPVRFEWRASSSAGDVIDVSRIRLKGRMPGMLSVDSRS
jgi:hypothetical protein